MGGVKLSIEVANEKASRDKNITNLNELSVRIVCVITRGVNIVVIDEIKPAAEKAQKII